MHGWISQRLKLCSLVTEIDREMQAVPKELLVDEGEDPQVAIETTEIDDKEVYKRTQTDLNKMTPQQQKEL